MFFVLSTGRAGSRTVAATLSQSPDCVCLHEPHPQLIEEATRYRYGELAGKEVARTLADSRPRTVEGKIYGEANNRLSLVVPVLRDVFPESRFVWLVRDGRDFVTSALQRAWFQPGGEASSNLWETWRPQGDRLGVVDPDEWASWTAFRRVCWLWAYQNRLIQQDLEGAGDARCWLLRLEELSESLDELATFLGIERTSWSVPRMNARQVATTSDPNPFEPRVNLVSTVASWQDWSREHHEIFEHECGPLMDELYPTWREEEGGQTRPDEANVSTLPRGAGEALTALRSDMGELKLLRGELQALLAHHRRTTRWHEEQLDRAHKETLEWRRHADKAHAEVEAAQRREQEVRTSTSFRLGHALVRAAKAVLPSRFYEASRRSTIMKRDSSGSRS